jgi:hypothetical protein
MYKQRERDERERELNWRIAILLKGSQGLGPVKTKPENWYCPTCLL